MYVAAQIACVFLSIGGGLYALWLLGDCYLAARSRTTRNKPADRAERMSVSTRVNWLLQFSLAGIFVVVAGMVVTSMASRHLTQGIPFEAGSLCSAQVPGMSALPPGRLFFDHTRPGRPLVGADLADLPITDADIQAMMIRYGTDIEFLNLTGTEISDETIQLLKQLPRLTGLTLTRTRISETGFKHMANLGSLECLTLTRTRIADDSLGHLSGLSNLKELRMQYTSVTDAGLEPLGQLQQLQFIACHGAQVTDRGIQQLASKLPRLAKSLSENEEE